MKKLMNYRLTCWNGFQYVEVPIDEIECGTTKSWYRILNEDGTIFVEKCFITSVEDTELCETFNSFDDDKDYRTITCQILIEKDSGDK